MGNTYRQPGNLLKYLNTGAAILSNAVVVLKAGRQGFIGVAEDDIPATTGVGALRIEEVVELACLSTDTGVVGDEFYWDAANARLTNVPTGNTRAGILFSTKASGETTAFVKLNEGELSSTGLLYNMVAAGTALTASSTETALGAYTVPASTLRVGDKLRVRFQGIATATNSTDTLTIKAYLGGLSGTAVLTGTATDVADNNIFAGEVEITVRTIGASGTFVAVGTHTDVPAASGTATQGICEYTASTAVDTTAAQDVTISGKWSTTSGSNSCRLDILSVELVR